MTALAFDVTFVNRSDIALGGYALGSDTAFMTLEMHRSASLSFGLVV